MLFHSPFFFKLECKKIPMQCLYSNELVVLQRCCIHQVCGILHYHVRQGTSGNSLLGRSIHHQRCECFSLDSGHEKRRWTKCFRILSHPLFHYPFIIFNKISFVCSLIPSAWSNDFIRKSLKALTSSLLTAMGIKSKFSGFSIFVANTY